MIIIKIMFYEDFCAFVSLAVSTGLQHRPQSYSADIVTVLTPPPFKYAPFALSGTTRGGSSEAG